MNENIEIVRHELALQRIQNNKEKYKRLAIACEKSKKIAQLIEFQEKLQHDLLRESLFINNKTDEIKKQLNHLEEQIKCELELVGLPDDYIKIKYKCSICNDIGYVETSGHKRRCDCFVQRLIELTYGDEPANYSKHSFELFDDSIFSENILSNGITQRLQMQTLKKVLEGYSNNFPKNEFRGIFLYGYIGLGKTYLLNCIRRRLLERGFTVLRLTSYQLFEELNRIHYSFGRMSIDRLLDQDMLIVDDLGTEPIYKNVNKEYMYTLVNELFENKKCFAFASNLSESDFIEKYTERTYSRVFDKSNVFAYRIEGKDLRVINK